MYLTESGIPANGSTFLPSSQLHLGRLYSHHTSLSPRSHLSFEVLAARKKKTSLRKDGEFTSSPAPVKPPSLFVKQSPVPNRKPLRCVPYTSLMSESDSESESRRKGELSRGGKKKLVSTSVPSQDGSFSKAEGAQVKERSDKVSKWASLFENAGNNQGGGNKDADAWFDKIFPKSGSQESKEGDEAPKLNAQQARSIQQLQTLVKTLGVANRNPAPPTHRNKPSKMRSMPVQGGVVDPVPFSSILKKLQSVSPSGQEVQRSKLEEAPARLGKLRRDVEEEDEDDDEEEEEDVVAEVEGDEVDEEDEDEEEEEEMSEVESEEETESEASSDEEEVKTRVVAAGTSTSLEVKTEGKRKSVDELSQFTMVALKAMARDKGLSGYSKLRKDDLVQLLASDS